MNPLTIHNSQLKTVLQIMITYPNGQTEHDTIPIKWQTLPADEYLYHYLLANTKLKAYSDGLPDEEQKVLKHFGVNYWESGMEEVMFDKTMYKAVDSGQWIVDSQKPYQPANH